jgi:hypothetical protein
MNDTHTASAHEAAVAGGAVGLAAALIVLRPRPHQQERG